MSSMDNIVETNKEDVACTCRNGVMSMVRQPIGPTTHWSENPLVRRPIGPKIIGPKIIGPKIIGPKKCVIGPTAHWSENVPLVRK